MGLMPLDCISAELGFSPQDAYSISLVLYHLAMLHTVPIPVSSSRRLANTRFFVLARATISWPAAVNCLLGASCPNLPVLLRQTCDKVILVASQLSS